MPVTFAGCTVIWFWTLAILEWLMVRYWTLTSTDQVDLLYWYTPAEGMAWNIPTLFAVATFLGAFLVGIALVWFRHRLPRALGFVLVLNLLGVCCFTGFIAAQKEPLYRVSVDLRDGMEATSEKRRQNGDPFDKGERNQLDWMNEIIENYKRRAR